MIIRNLVGDRRRIARKFSESEEGKIWREKIRKKKKQNNRGGKREKGKRGGQDV